MEPVIWVTYRYEKIMIRTVQKMSDKQMLKHQLLTVCYLKLTSPLTVEIVLLIF